MRVRGLSELIPWLCPVADGVVACKDGGLMATCEIGGRNREGVTPEEHQQLLQRAAAAVAELSIDPWSVVFTLRNSADLQYPAAPMRLQAASDIDAYHREMVESSASIRPRAYLSLHLGPPPKDDRFFGNVAARLKEGDSMPRAVLFAAHSLLQHKHAFAYRAEELVHAVLRVDTAMQRLQALLPEWRLRRLGTEEQLGLLRSLVSGHIEAAQPVQYEGNWFLDNALTDAPLEVLPDHLRLGPRYIVTLSLKEWPQATSPEVIEALIACGVPSTLSITMRLMSRQQAKAEIQKIRSYAELTQYGLKDYVKAMFAGASEPDDPSRADRDKRRIIDDTEAALEALAEGVAFGYMNMSIAVYGRDAQQANDAADHIIGSVSPVYPGIVRETLHAASAWAATLPGQMREPVRWALMHSGNLADSAPIYLPTLGEPRNAYFEEQTGKEAPALSVFPAAYGGHYYFNFHRGALGHTFVVGGSRSGKSVMMNFLISQFTKYDPSRVIIFDKDQSCRINTLMHDGVYYDLAGGTLKLNPLALVGDPSHWEFLSRWVMDVLASPEFPVNAQNEQIVRTAIESLARAHPSQWRLSDLATQLPLSARAALEPFIEGGRYAQYFDNEQDQFGLSAITAFEMGDLLRNARVAPLVMSYAFYRIQRLLEENRQPGKPVVPTFIYLEECWFLFENPVFAERVRDWLKTLAKFGAFVVMATQSLEDMIADNRKFFASIRDNVATMIFLPNPKAGTRSMMEVYKREFGLSDEVIADIASSAVRRDYIIVNDDHTKKISCSFTPQQLAYLRSDSRALQILNQEIERGGDWKARYLRRVLEDG